MSQVIADPKRFLTSLFEAAVAAADPEKAIRRFLPAVPKGRTIVVGAGKGVAQLARAFEAVWPRPVEGTVVTRYGYGDFLQPYRGSRGQPPGSGPERPCGIGSPVQAR